MATPDWNTKELELIREACRHGEAKLAAQVQVATSADQRATVLAGIYAATATGIMAALAASPDMRAVAPVLAGSLSAMLSFLLGAVLCVWATVPTSFWPPGNNPREWYADIDSGTPLRVAIGEQAAHFADAIDENDKTLTVNAQRFKHGAICGIVAPIMGIVVAGLTCLLV